LTLIFFQLFGLKNKYKYKVESFESFVVTRKVL